MPRPKSRCAACGNSLCNFAIDSRIELFPVAVWDAYDRVESGIDGWQNQLAEWGVTMVVVAADDTRLAGRLTTAAWRVVYQDADGSVSVAPGR